MKPLEKNFLLNVGVTNASETQILEYILSGLEKRGENYYIVTPNPEILVYANKHKDFLEILNNARLALPDGIGVVWGGKVLGKNFHGRVTGVDLMEKLCKQCSKKPITVGFLGGRPKIAERAAECLMRKYPTLKVGFVGSEWPEDESDLNNRLKIKDLRIKNKEKIINHKSLIINHPQVDILFVAFGAPKQEKWMNEHINKLPVRVMIGVGGSFDYISGDILRAPRFIQSLGFEWLFRLVVQPWRLKRQFALLEFIYLIIKEKLNSGQKS